MRRREQTLTRRYQNTASGRDIHHDAPLTNIAIRAFQSADGYIAGDLFPPVPVDKQMNRYYIIDPNSWLRIPNTARAVKNSPRRIEFKVSSDGYFADNYALANENAMEDLENADNALMLRENSVDLVTDALLRDWENRVASLVTSISNLGSGVALTGANKWSDYVNSDPVSDITTGHAFIRNNTGLVANTLALDFDTYQILRRHPLLIDYFKYVDGGLLADNQLRELFRVDRILIGTAIKNNALEGATASITNVWGNAAVLARVVPGQTMKTATFGLSFRWTPTGIAAPFAVSRYNDPDPGKKVEVIEAGYYQDEKVVAKNLSYGITGTL